MDWAKISDPELEGAFQKTAKIVFGREIGALSSFSGYLTEMMLPFRLEKSFISGKDLMVSLPFYSDNARFLSQDEAGMLKLEPLNVNEIKDIDSLFQAVRERAVYSGNKLFGTNFEVKNVDNSANCAHVSNSHGVYNTKYGAYISCMRESEYVFGASLYPDSKFSIRLCDGVGANRCFETYYGTNLSDTYYVFNCIGCHDCMFSFNLRSKRNVIGNLELPRDRYSTLKQKLVSEIADELARKKRIFSIAEIAFHGRDRKGLPDEETAYDSPVPPRVEQAFRSTTRLILGRERAGIRTFGPWLLRNAIKVKKIKGALGSPTYKIEGLPIVREIPADRLVTLVEGVSLSKSRHINLAEGEEPSLNELLEKVAKIAYFCVEFVDGQNENCVDTPSVFTGSNTYKLWDTTEGKYSAYGSIAAKSEHIFGGYLRILESQFCMNCYDPINAKGCLEVDSSYSARDSYFCHNCENIESCIFCFNAKSMSYAICNTPVSREEYSRIKKMLLAYVNKELDEKNSLGLSIFNLSEFKDNRIGARV